MPSPPSSASQPSEEKRRLEALHRYDVLDTPPEEQFERVVQLAARWFEVPIALIALLDSERQWFKAAVGLDRRETSREASFCAHHIYDSEVFIVENATKHPRFRDNPLVTGPPGIRFYAGAPLTSPRGRNVGALCLIDTEPRNAEAMDLGSLSDLAAIVVDELELRIRTEHLEERKQQVQALMRELTQAEEKTRDRLSHLLQEELQQVLQAARMQLQNFLSSNSLPDEQTEKIENVNELLDQAVNTTQALSARFAPPIGNQSLRDTFEWLAARMKETHGLTVSVETDGFVTVSDEELKKVLYRAVRELLFGVAKHASADEARLLLEGKGERLRIVVADDGNELEPERRVETSLGLTNLRERIEIMGGDIEVAFRPGEGTRATIKVPARINGSR